jgi:pseudaminic acid cytidylyltransferase
MRLAVIPARGGSKRIPRKNLKEFCGLPMIAWSIKAAIASQCFDRIIVSTDDEEIAQLALEFGAEVPFIRPAHLSDDYTGTIPVIAHAIEQQNLNTEKFQWVCCIYATAPFIQATDIKSAYQTLLTEKADYSFSVTSYPFPIQRAIKITSNQRVEMFEPQQFNTRSQDLEEAWHDAGQFYWGRADAWLQKKALFTKCAIPIPIPRYRVQDIDTPEDWERAEWIFKSMKQTERTTNVI